MIGDVGRIWQVVISVVQNWAYDFVHSPPEMPHFLELRSRHSHSPSIPDTIPEKQAVPCSGMPTNCSSKSLRMGWAELGCHVTLRTLFVHSCCWRSLGKIEPCWFCFTNFGCHYQVQKCKSHRGMPSPAFFSLSLVWCAITTIATPCLVAC